MNKKFIISYCSFSYNTTNISIFFPNKSDTRKAEYNNIKLKIIQIIISIKYFPEKKLYLKIVEFLFLKNHA